MSRMEFETFSNPPITEAILDITAVLPETVDLDKLASYQELLDGNFPVKREKISLTQNFEIRGGKPQTSQPSTTKHDGYLFLNEGRKVVQSRFSGFTYNKLPPYLSWKAFNEEARHLWEKYKNLVGPINISRVGLRYLNRIDIPLPVSELRDYCPLIPEIPSVMPQGMRSFLLRYSLPDDKTGAESVITVAFGPQHRADALSLILDIDVFFAFNLMDPDTNELWTKFEILRDFKNRIFFSSITDRARTLFYENSTQSAK